MNGKYSGAAFVLAMGLALAAVIWAVTSARSAEYSCPEVRQFAKGKSDRELATTIASLSLSSKQIDRVVACLEKSKRRAKHRR